MTKLIKIIVTLGIVIVLVGCNGPKTENVTINLKGPAPVLTSPLTLATLNSKNPNTYTLASTQLPISFLVNLLMGLKTNMPVKQWNDQVLPALKHLNNQPAAALISFPSTKVTVNELLASVWAYPAPLPSKGKSHEKI